MFGAGTFLGRFLPTPAVFPKAAREEVMGFAPPTRRAHKNSDGGGSSSSSNGGESGDEDIVYRGSSYGQADGRSSSSRRRGNGQRRAERRAGEGAVAQRRFTRGWPAWASRLPRPSLPAALVAAHVALAVCVGVGIPTHAANN